jgi:hypothetical protein
MTMRGTRAGGRAGGRVCVDHPGVVWARRHQELVLRVGGKRENVCATHRHDDDELRV